MTVSIDVSARGRALLFLLALSGLAGACTDSWSLRVISEASAPRILRAFDGARQVDRLVPPSGAAWVWIGPRTISGPILVIDPITCQVLSRLTDIPRMDALAEINWDDSIDAKSEVVPVDLDALAREVDDHSCP